MPGQKGSGAAFSSIRTRTNKVDPNIYEITDEGQAPTSVYRPSVGQALTPVYHPPVGQALALTPVYYQSVSQAPPSVYRQSVGQALTPVYHPPVGQALALTSVGQALTPVYHPTVGQAKAPTPVGQAKAQTFLGSSSSVSKDRPEYKETYNYWITKLNMRTFGYAPETAKNLSSYAIKHFKEKIFDFCNNVLGIRVEKISGDDFTDQNESLRLLILKDSKSNENKYIIEIFYYICESVKIMNNHYITVIGGDETTYQDYMTYLKDINIYTDIVIRDYYKNIQSKRDQDLADMRRRFNALKSGGGTKKSKSKSKSKVKAKA